MDEILPLETLEDIVNLLIRLVELAGALVIFTGAVLAFAGFVRRMVTGADSAGFSLLRLGLGRFLILGLEFQLASDILRTAVSPTFEDLFLLLLVAAIRTALNYVLRLEMRDEAAEVAALRPVSHVAPAAPPATTPPPPPRAPAWPPPSVPPT